MSDLQALLEKHCKPCEGGMAPIEADLAQQLVAQLNGWQLNAAATEISRAFSFKNYYHTMAFVNAIAYLAHQENHHPDLTVSYNRCVVHYHTHAIGGLSENDFICAAKVNKLVESK